MKEIISKIQKSIEELNLKFTSKPIIIGGMAMEYYGIRKSGNDIDMIITNEDYLKLAAQYPDLRKDLYGDLGMTIGQFEIWRSIAHLDYDFYRKEAIVEEDIQIVSIDRLLWSRVCAMDVEKYKKDLELMREYYYKIYTNKQYHEEAARHEKSYERNGGAVFAGKYED